MTYEVQRHGGRQNDDWRVIASTTERGKAEAKYNAVAEKMRQGGVRLVEWLPGHAPGVVSVSFAPRLRTRW